jgi:hypothetical protein
MNNQPLNPLLQASLEANHMGLQHDAALTLGVIRVLTDAWREELHMYGWLPDQTAVLAQNVLRRYQEKIAL